MAEVATVRPGQLAVGPIGRRGLGWWGVGTVVVTEAALFSYLLFAYYYTGATASPGWLLDPHPVLKLALPNTILLICSSLVAWYGERGVLEGRTTQALVGLGGAFVMACVFAWVQSLEWLAKPFRFGTNSYSSLYYITTGFHIAHVLVGIVVLGVIFLWTALHYFSPRRRLSVSAGVLYWHFVDFIWIFIFITYYVTPYLGFPQ